MSDDVPTYSASALDDLKLKIGKAAISRYLYDHCWYGPPDSRFTSSQFNEPLPPIDGPTGLMTFTYTEYAGAMGLASGPWEPPPFAEYEGYEYNELGGATHTYKVDPWTSIYAPIIEVIDDAFKGWETLPDPDDFDGPVERMRAATTALTPLPTSGGGNDPDGDFADDYSSVDLQANLDLLDDWIGPATAQGNLSALVFAFDDGYGAGRIIPLLTNQAQAAVVLGVALLGEQKVWQKARGDVMELGVQAEKKFDPRNDGGGSFNWGIVKAFAGLVSNFVPPPLQTVIGVGLDTLDLVQAILPPEEPKEEECSISGSTYDEILASMVEEIQKLESAIFDKEWDLVQSLQGLLGIMDAGAASQFHIHPQDGIAPDLTGEVIDVGPDTLRQIGYRLVPRIASVMGKSAELAQRADKPLIWERSNSIGYGTSGPYLRWKRVLDQFDAVTTGSGSELVEAGRLLAVGAGYLEDADNEASTALAGVRDDLDRGEHGWDNTYVDGNYPVRRVGWGMTAY